MKQFKFTISLGCILLCTCAQSPAISHTQEDMQDDTTQAIQSTIVKNEIQPLTEDQIIIIDSLLYDKHTIKDHYKYQKTPRSIKYDIIKKELANVENIQSSSMPWGVIQNYKNRNGEAPIIKSFKRNAYKRVADSLGTERYQSAPLYSINDTITPLIYGRDGNIVHICGQTENFYKIETIEREQWYIPKKYLKELDKTTEFKNIIVVDRLDQNIITLEWKEKGKWFVRSKNPATTGRFKPPYASPTPLGLFLVQEKKRKMVYLKDGSTATGGFAPYASRFTCGAYIHGVPVNAPSTSIVEYSWSLGTVPRSHMCVRNATSHAKFIYDWAPTKKSLVIVIE